LSHQNTISLKYHASTQVSGYWTFEVLDIWIRKLSEISGFGIRICPWPLGRSVPFWHRTYLVQDIIGKVYAASESFLASASVSCR